jgi:hypothetical protein
MLRQVEQIKELAVEVVVEQQVVLLQTMQLMVVLELLS